MYQSHLHLILYKSESMLFMYVQKQFFLGSKARQARKADKLTAIYEPIVKVMWDP
jgi:ABC-type cobalt transport system substrate-binding protein